MKGGDDMVTIIILTILLVVVSIIFAIIEGSIMILLKFGWLIICVLLIAALVKYLKTKKK